MRRLSDTRGVTFVEVMAATVIIGMLAAALQHATGFILETESEASSSWIIEELGLSLLEEVAATAFDDPQTGSRTLGLDAGEWPDLSVIPDHVDLPDPVPFGTGGSPPEGIPVEVFAEMPEGPPGGVPGEVPGEVPGGVPGNGAQEKTRAFFDDVDDYTIWDGTYPLQQKDGSGMGFTRYTRKVEVVYTTPASFTAASLVATAYKRITVQVLEDGKIVGEFYTIRVQGGRHVDAAS